MAALSPDQGPGSSSGREPDIGLTPGVHIDAVNDTLAAMGNESDVEIRSEKASKFVGTSIAGFRRCRSLGRGTSCASTDGRIGWRT